MNSNTIILLANGKGTRFKSNFNDIPKPLIKYKDKELITWSLKALKTIIPKSWDNTIVVSKYSSVREFIIKKFNFRVFDPGETNSPAETILKSKKLWEGSKILYTLDCDVYFEAQNLYKISPYTLYTVNSSSENFSYVKLAQNGTVNYIKEKEVISNQAIVGFYSFDTEKLKSLFKDKKYIELSSTREVFLSDIVRDQIKKGIKYSTSFVKNYKSLGTPIDLE